MRKKVLAALLAAAVAGTTVMSGMTVFAAETLSPQNSEKYFSVRITMYFSFLHSVQK